MLPNCRINKAHHKEGTAVFAREVCPNDGSNEIGEIVDDIVECDDFFAIHLEMRAGKVDL